MRVSPDSQFLFVITERSFLLRFRVSDLELLNSIPRCNSLYLTNSFDVSTNGNTFFAQSSQQLFVKRFSFKIFKEHALLKPKRSTSYIIRMSQKYRRVFYSYSENNFSLRHLNSNKRIANSVKLMDTTTVVGSWLSEPFTVIIGGWSNKFKIVSVENRIQGLREIQEGIQILTLTVSLDKRF